MQNVLWSDNIYAIGNYAFRGCSSLTYIRLPQNLTSIEDSLFYWCARLQSVTIPAGVQYIGEKAFNNCWALQKVTIPAGVQYVGEDAFVGCAADFGITWEYGNTGLTAEKFKEYLTEVHVADGVTAIAENAFRDCTRLQKLTVSASVETVPKNAFSGCNSALGITWEYGGTALTAENFRDYLTQVTFAKGTTTICPNAFRNCLLTDITIPEGIQEIGSCAFLGCTRLKSIAFPASVTEIGSSVLVNCIALESITVASKNPIFSAENNCLIWNDTLMAGCKTSCIPDYIKYISEYAFNGCVELESITIPYGVEEIYRYAFEGCTGLKSVVISDSVTSIDRYAFKDCTGLQDVKLSANLTQLSMGIFYGCTALTEVSLPENLTLVGSWAFSDCTALRNLYIPYGVRIIECGAFSGCRSLQYLYLPDSIELILSGAFGGSGLKYVALPNNDALIEEDAFWGCDSLESVLIPEYCDYWIPYFNYCYNLKAIYISRSAAEYGVLTMLCEPDRAIDAYVEYIFVPDEETAQAYREDAQWSYYADIIRPYADSELTENWVLISYVDYSEIDIENIDDEEYADLPLRDFLASGFKSVYSLTQTEDTDAVWSEIKGIVQANADANFLLYLTDALLKDGITSNVLYAAGLYDVTAIIATDRAAYYVAEESMATLRDGYSLGYSVACAYTEYEVTRISVDYVWNLYCCMDYTYVPVIAPSCLQNDVGFLMGISDVWRVPVRVAATLEEVEQAVNRVVGDYGITDMKWLVVDIEKCEFANDENYGFWSALVYFNIDITDLFIFGYDSPVFRALSADYNNVYIIKSKADTNDTIAYFMNWHERGIAVPYGNLVFYAADYWYSDDCFSENEWERENWPYYWTDLAEGETDFMVAWKHYEDRQYSLIRNFPPYWETDGMCLVAQSVECIKQLNEKKPKVVTILAPLP